MKRLLTPAFTLVLSLLIFYCAASLPNQKRIIGTWKVLKVEPYNIPSMPVQHNENAQKARVNANTDTTTHSAPVEKSKAEQMLDRFIQSELRSTLTVNADKTATKEFQGKTIHATWKLKNKGNRLLIDSKESGKKMTMDIQHINDTSAVVIETFPLGQLKVTYKKVKK